MSTQQPRNIFSNFSQASISSKIKQILNEDKQLKSTQSPKEQRFRVASTSKLKTNSNTRPITSQQYQLKQQTQQQQLMQDSNKNNQQRASIGYQQNIPRLSFQRINLEQSPQVKNFDQNIRMVTSFPGSPSMNYYFQKGTQQTWMPTDNDYSETKQLTSFSMNISSSPQQKKMQIYGYNQVNIDRALDQNEIYVMHNAQGNKYKNKLNSQVKAKLNKKNEIIKQFLNKNMKPSQSNGFMKWLESLEQANQDISQQESESKYLHKSPSHNQLLSQYNQKKMKYQLQNSETSPLMLGVKNRDFIVKQQPSQIRPTTSLLQRSKVLIPQTKAQHDFNQQQQMIINNSKQFKRNQLQNQSNIKNQHSQQPQKSDQASQSFEENNENNFFLQIPQKQNNYMYELQQEEYYQQNDNLNLKQVIFEQLSQLENDDKQTEHLPINIKKPSYSSNNSTKNMMTVTQSNSQKQFKNQTEQTNFPDQNFSSLNSFEEFSMERERIKSVQSSEMKQKQITSNSLQKKKAQTNNQIGALKNENYPQIQPQIFNKSSTQLSMQVQPKNHFGVQKNYFQMKEEFRKKSIRGWSFVSEDEIQETLTFRQNFRSKDQ